jgi:rhodanese-related sulfurtransferase
MIHNREKYHIARFIWIIIWTCAPGAVIVSVSSAAGDSIDSGANAPICGLYCVYAAGRLDHKSMNFETLLRTEYLGSPDGSTMAELAAAARDHGLYVSAFTDIGVNELKSGAMPVILRVKYDPSESDYNHYYLLIGARGDRAAVLDPPAKIRDMTWPGLMMRCDGNALFVSSSPIDARKILGSSRLNFLFFAAAALVAIGLLKMVGSRVHFSVAFGSPTVSRAAGTLFGMAAILTISATVAATYHLTSATGLLASVDVAGSVREAHSLDFVSTADLQTVRGMVADARTVFVDARLKPDFDDGHLPGAISIPVNASDEQRHQRLSGIPKDMRIVVYCESLNCPYSREVARKLIDDGYYNLQIFKGGWAEWSKAALAHGSSMGRATH